MVIYINQVIGTLISVVQNVWSIFFSLTIALIISQLGNFAFRLSYSWWVLVFLQTIHLEAKEWQFSPLCLHLYVLALFVCSKNTSYGHEYCFLQLGKCSAAVSWQQAWSGARLQICDAPKGFCINQKCSLNERLLLPLCPSEPKYGFHSTRDSTILLKSENNLLANIFNAFRYTLQKLCDFLGRHDMSDSLRCTASRYTSWVSICCVSIAQ